MKMKHIISLVLLDVIIAQRPTIGDYPTSSRTSSAFKTSSRPNSRSSPSAFNSNRDVQVLERLNRRRRPTKTESHRSFNPASSQGFDKSANNILPPHVANVLPSNGIGIPPLSSLGIPSASGLQLPASPNPLGGLFGGGGGGNPLGGLLSGGSAGGLGGSPLGGLLSGGGAGGGAGGNLLGVLQKVGSSLGRQVGLGNGLGGQSSLGGLGSLVGLGLGGGGRGGSFGPPAPGIPSVAGLLGGGSGGGNFDVMGLVASLSRRALNGSSVGKALPPQRIEAFADNVTNQLVPELPEVDLNKYMGRWFEGIGSPKASDQRCVVHHYGGLTENGKTATFTALKIYRFGSEFGQVQYSIGYAFRGGRDDSMLQMHSSETSDANPYWIYMLGPLGKDVFGNPQYEYAVISNWIKYPVTVLVRDPDVFQKKYYVDVLRWLEDNQFISDFSRAFNLVQPIDYSNCQYDDSTFQQFG